VVVLAWFAIIWTGRMPGRQGGYLMGVLRYRWGVGAFLLGLTDRCPGFRVVAGAVRRPSGLGAWAEQEYACV
jgi:hypothetical protein